MLQPVNLFGTDLHVDSSVIASDNRVNCFLDIRKSDTGSSMVVRGTPGTVGLDLTPAPSAAHVINDVIYWVAADGSGLWSSGGPGGELFLGHGPQGYPYCSMADCYSQLIIVTGFMGWIYDIPSGHLSQITDPNFPTYTKSVCFISGRFVVNDPDTRRFYCSAALDGTTWTYLSLPMFATKEQASDALYMTVSQNGILVLLGFDTTEFWQDAGLSPVPFQLIQGTTQAYGTHSRYTVRKVNDSILFLGKNPQGSLGVYSIKGYSITKVSTTDIDEILANWVASGATLNYTKAVTFSAHGHDFYQLTDGPSRDNGTLLYDATTGVWSKGYDISWSTQWLGKTVVWGNTVLNGEYATLDTNSFTSSFDVIQRQITTKHLRQNGNEFAISELVLLVDTGTAPLNKDYGITLEVSRDGGRTFGSPRRRSLGLTGQYRDPRVKWDRLGSAIDFVLRFTLTDPMPLVIAGALWEVSVNG